MPLSLTPEEHSALTIALRLERAGFTEAAQWLREQILCLRGVTWEDPVIPQTPLTPAQIEEVRLRYRELFRTHRGSPAPFTPPPAPPTSVKVEPRADQPIA